MKTFSFKKYFPLFGVLAIAVAIVPTVIISQQTQTAQQNAACLGNHLRISGPVQLSTDTVSVGNTIKATVSYFNDGQCDVYIRDMAIAGRPPGAPQSDPNNQYGKYAFLPEKFNFTMHPGQSVTINGSLTIQQEWLIGQGWYSFAAYQTGNGNWHGNDNPKVYFTVIPSVGQNTPIPTASISCQSVGSCAPWNFSCPQGSVCNGHDCVPKTCITPVPTPDCTNPPAGCQCQYIGGNNSPTLVCSTSTGGGGGTCASLFHGVCSNPGTDPNNHGQCPKPNANGIYYNYGHLDCGSTMVCCNVN